MIFHDRITKLTFQASGLLGKHRTSLQKGLWNSVQLTVFTLSRICRVANFQTQVIDSHFCPLSSTAAPAVAVSRRRAEGGRGIDGRRSGWIERRTVVPVEEGKHGRKTLHLLFAVGDQFDHEVVTPGRDLDLGQRIAEEGQLL